MTSLVSTKPKQCIPSLHAFALKFLLAAYVACFSVFLTMTFRFSGPISKYDFFGAMTSPDSLSKYTVSVLKS